MKNIKFQIITLTIILTITLTLNILINDTIYANEKIIPVCTDAADVLLPSSERSFRYGKEDGTIICWLEVSGHGSLHAQKIDAEGNTVWNKKGVTADTDLGSGFTEDSDYPKLFSDNEGGAVIIYRKIFYDREDIYAQKISAGGEVKNKSVCISSYYGGYNYSPSAVLTKNNRIAVTWENFNNGNFNIHAQMIDLNLRKIWNKGTGLVVCDDAADQRKPTIVCGDNNMIYITWLDAREHDNNYAFDLFANSIRITGKEAETGSKGKMIFKNYANTNSRKIVFYNHNLIQSDSNSFITALENTDGSTYSNIDVIKVNENLDKIWDIDLHTHNFQSHPLIISDSKSGADVIWKEAVDYQKILFATNIDRNGIITLGNGGGIKISCDDRINGNDKIIPSAYNQNGIFRIQNKTALTWVNAHSDKLILRLLNLTDESRQCENTFEIQNNISEGEYTSVTTARNNVVVVYKQFNGLYALVKEISDNSSSESDQKTILENFPNPFNPSTTINYIIPSDGFVRLSVFDITGRLKNTLVNEYKTAGKYEATFNGSGFSSGVYFYRLEINGAAHTNRMTMLK